MEKSTMFKPSILSTNCKFYFLLEKGERDGKNRMYHLRL